MSRLHLRNAQKLVDRSWWREKLFQTYLRFAAGPPQSGRIEGFLDPIEERCLQWAAQRVPRGGTIVEVGSYHGKSAVNLAYAVRAAGNQAKIFCVDTWMNSNIETALNVDVYGHFLDNTKEYRDIITMLRGRSEDLGKVWEGGPIDLLFIDGDHTYEGVSADIHAWVPHLKPGGWVLFHDSGLDGVRRGIEGALDVLRPDREAKAWSIRVFRKGR